MGLTRKQLAARIRLEPVRLVTRTVGQHTPVTAHAVERSSFQRPSDTTKPMEDTCPSEVPLATARPGAATYTRSNDTSDITPPLSNRGLFSSAVPSRASARSDRFAVQSKTVRKMAVASSGVGVAVGATDGHQNGL